MIKIGYKFVGDQNKLVGFNASGTTITNSGAWWPGIVTSHSIDENENVTPVRYAGAASRNVQLFTELAQTFDGTISYNPQDFRILKFVLGSCVDAGSPSPYTHAFVETNNDGAVLEHPNTSLPAFGLEDSKSVLVAGSGLNFVRTLNGCFVKDFSLSLEEGGLASCSVSYVARQLSFSSGATTSVTADTGRPFRFSDFAVHIPSGTTFSNFKTLTVDVNNNLDVPNYLDGARTVGDPIPGNRDYSISLSSNADSADAKTFYDQYFIGGSTFNMMLLGTLSTGSRVLRWTFSGCRLSDMTAPTELGGVQAFDLTITPQISDALEDSSTFKYNGW